MRRTTATLASLLMLCALASAQTPHKSKPTIPAVKQSAGAAKTRSKPAVAASSKSAAPAGAQSASVPSNETVETFLNRMFGYNDDIQFRVAGVVPADVPGVSSVYAVVSTPQGQQQMNFFVMPDGKHAIMGEMMPFGVDPYGDKREAIKSGAFGATKGPADAKMLAVEFADLQCPACKQALPTIQRLQADFPQVKWIFQNFPLEKMHPWAGKAARYLDCIQRQSNDGAWTFIEAVYNHQSEITDANVGEKLNSYAKTAGADPAKIAACSTSPETEQRIQKGLQLGQQLGLTGTPTLYVNGRPLQTFNPQDYDVVKSIVQFELNQAEQGK